MDKSAYDLFLRGEGGMTLREMYRNVKAQVRTGPRDVAIQSCKVLLDYYIQYPSQGSFYILLPVAEIPMMEAFASLMMTTFPELLEEGEALQADVAETKTIQNGLREAALR